jgi:hypothetical protein
MLLTLIFIFLYTSLAYIIWIRKSALVNNIILKISLSWVVGYYLTTFIIFLTSTILVNFTSGVLEKSSLLLLLAMVICAFFYRKDYKNLFRSKIKTDALIDIAIAFSLFMISLFLFIPHLQTVDGEIRRSPVYWDFGIHATLIQNFVFGDNYPPQNVSFSGFPLAYHFFWYFSCAIYASLGLGLTGSFNLLSIVSFLCLLLTLYGLAIEFFKSRSIGLVTIVLTITSGSLRFLHDVQQFENLGLPKFILSILNNKTHPYFFSLLPNDPFGYNGNMFNIFYFIEERQLIFPIIFLLFALIIILKRKILNKKICFIMGIFMGLFVQWHLYITLMILPVLITHLLPPHSRKKTLIMLIGYGLVLGAYYVYFRSLTNSEWFLPAISKFPAVNFDFPTMPKTYPLSLLNAIGYYLFAYGLKTVFFFCGMYLLWKTKKQFLLLFASIIIPTFILINSVQLSPLSIYDNHKWLKPLNVVMDIIVAFTLVKLYLMAKYELYRLTLIFLSFFLVLGGFIELMPYVNSQPTVYVGNESSETISSIRQYTKPQAVFISSKDKILLFAGRKIFLSSNMIIGDFHLNTKKREEIISQIYQASSRDNFCALTAKYNIDYVEYDESLTSLNLSTILKTPSFIDVAKNCHQESK